ncbi:hypothetical protein CsSME_00011548 [Camellia sinensis var. sinensis]
MWFYLLKCPNFFPRIAFSLNQNGKFSYGYASSLGKRSTMEDFYETRIDGVDGEIVGLFGVFDGTHLLSLSFQFLNSLFLFLSLSLSLSLSTVRRPPTTSPHCDDHRPSRCGHHRLPHFLSPSSFGLVGLVVSDF